MSDQETFSRGYDSNEAKLSKIVSVKKVSDDVMQIIATTQGSDLYKQTINVYNRGESIKLLGQCSCYVGINCKHIISASLAHLDSVVEVDPLPKNPTLDDSKLHRWMDELLAIEDEEENFPTSTVLLYELRLSRSMVDVDMTLYTARVLKNGGFGKVNKARPTSIFSQFSTPEYFRESDKEAIPFFRALGGAKEVSVSLRGKLGALLLEAALKTGRCFWQRSHKQPLTMAAPRILQTKWLDVDGYHSRLGFDIGEQSFVVNTEPLFYCDSKSKVVGVIESDLSRRQLELLAKAPLIPNEQKSVVSSKLTKHLDLPMQSDQEVSVIEGVAPKPVIHFFAQKEQHAVKLLFHYDDVTVAGLPLRVSSFIDSEEAVRVLRDQSSEKSYLAEILRYGFVVDKDLIRPDTALEKNQQIEAWHALVEAKADLESLGFEVITDESFLYRFESISEVDVSVEAESHWFDVSMHIHVNGQDLPLLPIISQLIEQKIPLDELPSSMHFALSDTQFISLDATIFRPILAMIYELFGDHSGDHLKLSSYDARALDNLQSDSFSMRKPKELEALTEGLKNLDTLKQIDAPKTLNATLRDYQVEGVTWLGFLREYGFGGILADDMGLGKTLQTLAHLLYEKEAGRLEKPVLIVAPTSLLGNWKNEAHKFTPSLKVAVSHGNSRKKILKKMEDYDIIVTTYTLIHNDIEKLKEQKFYYLILDEAQKIKNSRSQASQAVKKIDSEHFLALTGTPMENHLGELWSIFDVVASGLLGSQKLFKTLYQNPIEKEQDQSRQEMLNKRVQPFMMRRTKEKVAKELPAKTEILRSIPFENEQATLYETIRVTMEKKVRDSIKEMGLSKSHITILDALLKLRQVCCDPKLLAMPEAQAIEQSAKLSMLLDLVLEMIEEGRKILIFSQFTSMLALIADALDKEHLAYAKLTGSTTNRDRVIERFQKGEVDIFLISLKAGGVGLNLTQADTVIHYDPWWNPAAQDQATDRAYRIGQDKPVFVYKLIIENSVEEKIVAMQESKRSLANNLFENANEGMKSFDSEALLELFK
jgi:SNF2 family DNA or RNA helicase